MIESAVRSEETRVVAITSEFPWPLDTGGHIRTYHLLRALAAAVRLTLVVPIDEPNLLLEAALDRAGVSVRPVNVGRRNFASEAIRAARARVGGDPYVFFRRHDRSAVRREFADTLKRVRPHIVYCDHLDSFAFADLCGTTPLVLDLHNAYSLLARRSADSQSSVVVRRYLRGESRRLEKVERAACSRARVILTVSAEERAYFQSLGGSDVRLVPNGVDCAAYEALSIGRLQPASPVVLYVGGLSWAPNAEAAITLITEIMPEVRKRIPAARVCVVGRGASQDLLRQRQHDWVEVAGGVPDVRPYLEKASVVAVPLAAGGGTRLKILEAFAAGVPVVSTAVGSEGIEARDGIELVIAEKAEMAAGIVRVLQDRELAQRLATNARALVRRQYDWNVVGRSAVDAVVDAAPQRSVEGR